MDIPEILWKSYIDFEVEQEEWHRVRTLYEKLLEKTKHLKVWQSFAKFEVSIEEMEAAREVRDSHLCHKWLMAGTQCYCIGII